MLKKIVLIHFLVMIFIVIFTTNIYASSKFSVYDKNSQMYHLDIPFKKVTEYAIENCNAYCEYNSPDIYFLLQIHTDGYYYLYTSDTPFMVSNYNSQGYPNVTTIDFSTFQCSMYKVSTSIWTYKGDINSSLLLLPKFPIISSDDVYLYNSNQIVYKKYTFLTPLTRTVKNMELKNSVTKEIVSILPVTLVVVVGLIGIRKGILFIKDKTKTA